MKAACCQGGRLRQRPNLKTTSGLCLLTVTDKREAHREGTASQCSLSSGNGAGRVGPGAGVPTQRGAWSGGPRGREEAWWGSAGCVLGESGGRPPGPWRGSTPPRRLTLAQPRPAPGRRLPEGSRLGVWVCGEHGRHTGAGALA